jgi:hypothetical protein
VISSAAVLSCGGDHSSIPTPSTPNIAGAWEFIAVSQTGANTGAVTGIEAAISEGQVIVNGLPQPNGQVSARSDQIAFVLLSPSTLNITEFGGACQTVPGASSLSGSITTPDAPFQFMFTENGNDFTVNGTLSGDGKSLLNGTYTAQSANGCDAGGTITGIFVSKITGTFLGQMCALGDTSSPCQPQNDVTAIASENSSSILTLNLTLTGADNTTLTLSGPVTGNSFVVNGTVQGQVVTYYGYYEAVNNVPAIYLADATTNPATPNYVGTLAIPH